MCYVGSSGGSSFDPPKYLHRWYDSDIRQGLDVASKLLNLKKLLSVCSDAIASPRAAKCLCGPTGDLSDVKDGFDSQKFGP